MFIKIENLQSNNEIDYKNLNAYLFKDVIYDLKNNICLIDTQEQETNHNDITVLTDEAYHNEKLKILNKPTDNERIETLENTMNLLLMGEL